ncbi:restriction endonuclease [Candidatus Tenderia electrophaga]|uniref:Restriction endonuclease n=1 Tax=Candidatus Tenderia electrophaga TaxID=1748243 RepID=A0A0S2TI64_9GAMM|nr:restriction endonuclease [Candidatus Tenderia electrophaga]
MWMVRAGRGAEYVDYFIDNRVVAIGWNAVGEINPGASRDEISAILRENRPNMPNGRVAISSGQIYRFLNEINIGDYVVTYDPSRRIYHIGEITSAPRYSPSQLEELPRIRDVKWMGEVQRDNITTATRNTLGAISTLFLLSQEACEEMLSRLKGEQFAPAVQAEEEAEETEALAQDLRAKSREFIKDNISRLDWAEMQELVAGLLRAMGYKTRISPSGPDRGKDIVASPDGFGFESPRIVVEVKHRPNTAMGSQEIRSFLGGRHQEDKGLYVSTGGFSKDARYEAERAAIPLVLLDLDDLVKEILRHYENMDMEAKAMIPLTNIYWPA